MHSVGALSNAVLARKRLGTFLHASTKFKYMTVFVLQILLKEDTESKSDGTTGPCLEYLLKHNLLDLLATLATSDDPPGMRQYVLRFITQTLNHLKAPILAHNSVFPSLQVLPSEITHFSNH